MFCERIFHAIDFIGIHTFVDHEMGVLLNREEGLFLFKLHAYKEVFPHYETGYVANKIILRIKKMDVTCLKDQIQYNPIFLSNLKKAALKSLEYLAMDWVLCPNSNNEYYCLPECNDIKLIKKTQVDYDVYSLLDKLAEEKSLNNIRINRKNRIVYVYGYLEHLKEFLAALRFESLGLVNSPLSLLHLTSRSICYADLDFQHLPKDLIEKITEESKFCFKNE